MNYDAAGYAIVLLLMYFLPTILANKGRRMSVFVINFFFGWTILGWCIAMYMAVRSMEDAKRGA
jgi:hypothetical protein